MVFLGLLNTFFGSNSWFSVDRFPPLISLGFVWKSTPVAQSLRAMPKHSSRNDLCSLCSFSKREKLHRQFLDGQTDQKLQSLFWAYFWTEFRYTQIIRGRIDGSQGVVFWTPSKYLCTEILYYALIEKGRDIEKSRTREWGIYFLVAPPPWDVRLKPSDQLGSTIISLDTEI